MDAKEDIWKRLERRCLNSCCNVLCDFSVKTMFSSFLLILVCRDPMLFVYIYVFWCPTRFPYYIMFMLEQLRDRWLIGVQELLIILEHLGLLVSFGGVSFLHSMHFVDHCSPVCHLCFLIESSVSRFTSLNYPLDIL